MTNEYHFDDVADQPVFGTRFAMHTASRFMLNRQLIMLMPMRAILEWIERVYPNSPNPTLDQLCREQNAFLVYDFF